MNEKFKILDVVALLKSIPESNLIKGQVGTVVEILDQKNYEVEFCNKKGETLITHPINENDLLLLHYELEVA